MIWSSEEQWKNEETIWLIGRLNAEWADLVDSMIERWVSDWMIWSSDLQHWRTKKKKKKEKIKRKEEERVGKNKTVKLKFNVDIF